MLSMKVVLCFLVLCAVAVGDGPPNFIHYPNYGVYMKYQGEVDLTVRPWVHEFRMPMPKLSDFYGPQLPSHCASASSNGSATFDCKRTPLTVDFVRALDSLVEARFQQFSENIKLQLPETRSDWEDKEAMSWSRVPSKKHHTKSDIPHLSKEFLNTDVLAELTVPELYVKPHNPDSFIQDKDVVGLLEYADDLRQGVLKNDEHLRGLAGNITYSLRNMTYDSLEMARAVADTSIATLTALRQLDAVERDLVTLSHGRATGSLLDDHDIVAAIRAAMPLPEFVNSRFEFVGLGLQHYQLDNVRATREADDIVIRMELPVTSGRPTPFYVYKTEAYPLATSQRMNATAATVLGGFQPYLLLSEDGQMYMELSEDQMRQCSGNGVLRMCEQSFASLSVNVPSCHLAIFTDDVDTVVEKCHLSLLKAGLRTSMLEVDPGLYVINKQENVQLNDCTGSRPDSGVVESCVQCVLRVPCQCKIRSEMLSAAPRLPTECTDKSTSPPTPPLAHVYHPANLVLLRQAGRSTGDLTGRTLLDKASMEEYAAEMSEDQVATLAGENAKQIRLNVLNEPAELSPGSVSAGTVMCILLTLLFIGFLVFYVRRNRRLQEEIKRLSRRQTVQVPLAAGDQELQEDELE